MANITIDHDHIRSWAEQHNATPARVKGTGREDDKGIIRLEFGTDDERLEKITWDDWFAAFEDNELALLHNEEDRFNKLVSRESVRDQLEA